MIWIRRVLVSVVWSVLILQLTSGCVFDTGGLGVVFGLYGEPPPDACVGEPYYHRFRAENGQEPYTFKLHASSQPLPAGLKLDGATGALFGKPTEKAERKLRIEVVDTRPENFIGDYTLRTDELAITTSEIPWACSKKPLDFQLRACGGEAPLTWSVASGTLPKGLQLAADGRLKGSFSLTSAVGITVLVKDSKGKQATRDFKLRDTSGLSVLSPHRLSDGAVGQSYGPFTFTACGGKTPYAWDLPKGSTLPTNLTLSGGGSLAGKPTKAGEYDFDVQLKDASAKPSTTTHHALLRVLEIPLAISTASPLADALECQQYQQTLAAKGGSGTYAWALVPPSQPPDGLSLSTSGLLSGSASKPSATPSTFTVQVDDGQTKVSKALQLTVKEDTTVSPALTVTEVQHAAAIQWNEISLSRPPNVKIDFRVAGGGAASPKKSELQVIGGDCTALSTKKFLPPSDVNGDGQPEHVVVYNSSLVKGLLATAGKKAGDKAKLRFRVDMQVDQKVTSYVQLHEILIVP